MAVFVIMHFVPGGPVERQIMRYKMATMEGRRRRTPAVDVAAGGRNRRNPPVLRVRQAGSRPLHRVAREGRASRSRQLVHLSGTGVGRHQVPVSRLAFPRTHRISAQLPRLRAARRIEGREARQPLRFRDERAGVSGLFGARLGARNGAAGAVRRRQLLERVSPRRIPAGQLGISERSARRSLSRHGTWRCRCSATWSADLPR